MQTHKEFLSTLLPFQCSTCGAAAGKPCDGRKPSHERTTLNDKPQKFSNEDLHKIINVAKERIEHLKDDKRILDAQMVQAEERLAEFQTELKGRQQECGRCGRCGACVP